MKAKRNTIFILTCLLLIFFCSAIQANVKNDQKTNKEEEPPEIGNFALPTSQQPGPLTTIGQNIIDKNQTQIFFYGDAYIGENKHYTDIIPGLVYQAWENCSIFINVPYASEYQENESRSAGIEDIYGQLEYAYYKKTTKDYFDQATVLATAAVPTGSNKKNPATGTGSMSYFIGTTYTRTYVDWILFTAYGVVFTTGNRDIKYGNDYFYQAGIGKNICSIKSKLIVNWLVEISGTYAETNKVNYAIDSNSGGNLVYVTPSLWVSTSNLILQLGVGFPVIQQLNGLQNKNYYLLVGSLGWTF